MVPALQEDHHCSHHMSRRQEGNPAALAFKRPEHRSYLNPRHHSLGQTVSLVPDPLRLTPPGDPPEVKQLHGNQTFGVVGRDDLRIWRKRGDSGKRSDMIIMSVTDQDQVDVREIRQFAKQTLIIRVQFLSLKPRAAVQQNIGSVYGQKVRRRSYLIPSSQRNKTVHHVFYSSFRRSFFLMRIVYHLRRNYFFRMAGLFSEYSHDFIVKYSGRVLYSSQKWHMLNVITERIRRYG